MSLQATSIEVRAGAKVLIEDMSLTLAPGEFLAVIGPNGAGKSTLLGALAGDRSLTKGRVLLDGEPLPVDGFTALEQRQQRLTVRAELEEVILLRLADQWLAVDRRLEPGDHCHVRSARQRDHAGDEPQRQGHQRNGRGPLRPPVGDAFLGGAEAADATQRRAQLHHDLPMTE